MQRNLDLKQHYVTFKSILEGDVLFVEPRLWIGLVLSTNVYEMFVKPQTNTMSSGSVNITGVNSCVVTQVFYFESIHQKHVCLSLVCDAELNITGLVLVLVLICRLED